MSFESKDKENEKEEYVEVELELDEELFKSFRKIAEKKYGKGQEALDKAFQEAVEMYLEYIKAETLEEKIEVLKKYGQK